MKRSLLQERKLVVGHASTTRGGQGHGLSRMRRTLRLRMGSRRSRSEGVKMLMLHRWEQGLQDAHATQVLPMSSEAEAEGGSTGSTIENAFARARSLSAAPAPPKARGKAAAKGKPNPKTEPKPSAKAKPKTEPKAPGKKPRSRGRSRGR